MSVLDQIDARREDREGARVSARESKRVRRRARRTPVTWVQGGGLAALVFVKRDIARIETVWCAVQLPSAVLRVSTVEVDHAPPSTEISTSPPPAARYFDGSSAAERVR